MSASTMTVSELGRLAALSRRLGEFEDLLEKANEEMNAIVDGILPRLNEAEKREFVHAAGWEA